jgi:hypothetical protein
VQVAGSGISYMHEIHISQLGLAVRHSAIAWLPQHVAYQCQQDRWFVLVVLVPTHARVFFYQSKRCDTVALEVN